MAPAERLRVTASGPGPDQRRRLGTGHPASWDGSRRPRPTSLPWVAGGPAGFFQHPPDQIHPLRSAQMLGRSCVGLRCFVVGFHCVTPPRARVSAPLRPGRCHRRSGRCDPLGVPVARNVVEYRGGHQHLFRRLRRGGQRLAGARCRVRRRRRPATAPGRYPRRAAIRRRASRSANANDHDSPWLAKPFAGCSPSRSSKSSRCGPTRHTPRSSSASRRVAIFSSSAAPRMSTSGLVGFDLDAGVIRDRRGPRGRRQQLVSSSAPPAPTRSPASSGRPSTPRRASAKWPSHTSRVSSAPRSPRNRAPDADFSRAVRWRRTLS